MAGNIFWQLRKGSINHKQGSRVVGATCALLALVDFFFQSEAFPPWEQKFVQQRMNMSH